MCVRENLVLRVLVGLFEWEGLSEYDTGEEVRWDE